MHNTNLSYLFTPVIDFPFSQKASGRIRFHSVNSLRHSFLDAFILYSKYQKFQMFLISEETSLSEIWYVNTIWNTKFDHKLAYSL